MEGESTVWLISKKFNKSPYTIGCNLRVRRGFARGKRGAQVKGSHTLTRKTLKRGFCGGSVRSKQHGRDNRFPGGGKVS